MFHELLRGDAVIPITQVHLAIISAAEILCAVFVFGLQTQRQGPTYECTICIADIRGAALLQRCSGVVSGRQIRSRLFHALPAWRTSGTLLGRLF